MSKVKPLKRWEGWQKIFNILLPFFAIIKEKSTQEKGQKEKTFNYKFQSFPFSDFHFFSVKANSAEEAEAKAKKEFEKLFSEKKTVMTIFHRA